MSAAARRVIDHFAPHAGLPVRIARRVGHHRRAPARCRSTRPRPTASIRLLWHGMQLSDVLKRTSGSACIAIATACSAAAGVRGAACRRASQRDDQPTATASDAARATDSVVASVRPPQLEAVRRRTSPRAVGHAPACRASERSLTGMRTPTLKHDVLEDAQASPASAARFPLGLGAARQLLRAPALRPSASTRGPTVLRERLADARCASRRVVRLDRRGRPATRSRHGSGRKLSRGSAWSEHRRSLEDRHAAAKAFGFLAGRQRHFAAGGGDRAARDAVEEHVLERQR